MERLEQRAQLGHPLCAEDLRPVALGRDTINDCQEQVLTAAIRAAFDLD